MAEAGFPVENHWPALSMGDGQVREKVTSFCSCILEFFLQVLAIISRINQNIFALPFLHQKSIDELSKSVRENGYRSSDEILTDLERLFCWGEASGAQELTLINADQQRRFSLSGHEMERMAEEMRRNLALWVKETFAGEGGDEVRRGESDQIFEALVKRFPHLPQEELKVKSCMIKPSPAHKTEPLTWDLSHK